MTDATASYTPLLPVEALERLRADFKEEVMREASRNKVIALYPPGTDYANAIVDSLYSGQPISAVDRERCLIALLCQQDALMLAIHLYWGMMAGLDEEEVAHTILLTGAYTGVPVYTTAMGVLQRTCGALARLVSDGASPLDARACLGALVMAF